MTEKSPITNPPNVLSFEKAYLFPSYLWLTKVKRAPADADTLAKVRYMSARAWVHRSPAGRPLPSPAHS